MKIKVIMYLGLMIVLVAGCATYSEPKKINASQVEQLPDKLSLQELFSRWGSGLNDALNTDPQVYFYLTVEDDYYYWIFWDQRDSEALSKREYEDVRVKTIALVKMTAPMEEKIVWGQGPSEMPYIPSANPFKNE